MAPPTRIYYLQTNVELNKERRHMTIMVTKIRRIYSTQEIRWILGY
jgi:hypothetical protein